MNSVNRRDFIRLSALAATVPSANGAKGKARVLYVGDSSMTAGTTSPGSNFTYDQRGVKIAIDAEKILEAWRRNSRLKWLPPRIPPTGRASNTASIRTPLFGRGVNRPGCCGSEEREGWNY